MIILSEQLLHQANLTMMCLKNRFKNFMFDNVFQYLASNPVNMKNINFI